MSSHERDWWRRSFLAFCCVLGSAPGVAVAQDANELLTWSSALEEKLTAEQEGHLRRLRAIPGVTAVRVAAVNSQSLRSGNAVNVTLDQGGRPAILRGGFEPCGRLRDVWHGSDEIGSVSAMLLVQGSRVRGTVWTHSAAYEITPLWAPQRDLAAVMEVSCRNVYPESQAKAPCKVDGEFLEVPSMDCPEKLRPGSHTIALLAAYTASARETARDPTWYGDPDLEMEQIIELAVCTANRTYRASGISLQLSLVGAVETNYKEESATDCRCLLLDTDRLRVDGDGHLDEVHRYRDVLAADLVVLLTGSRSCPGMVAPPKYDAEMAFAVVGIAFASSGYALAHEIGHLQGAKHVISGNTGFKCAHGKCGSGWRTIMAGASECAGDTCLAGIWSNPALMYRGEWAGSKDQDNARVLNFTAGAIEGYRRKGTLDVTPGLVTVAPGHTVLLRAGVTPREPLLPVWVRPRDFAVALVKSPNGAQPEEWHWAENGQAQFAVQGVSAGATVIDVRSEGVHVLVPVRVVPASSLLGMVVAACAMFLLSRHRGL